MLGACNIKHVEFRLWISMTKKIYSLLNKVKDDFSCDSMISAMPFVGRHCFFSHFVVHNLYLWFRRLSFRDWNTNAKRCYSGVVLWSNERWNMMKESKRLEQNRKESKTNSSLKWFRVVCLLEPVVISHFMACARTTHSPMIFVFLHSVYTRSSKFNIIRMS